MPTWLGGEHGPDLPALPPGQQLRALEQRKIVAPPTSRITASPALAVLSRRRPHPRLAVLDRSVGHRSRSGSTPDRHHRPPGSRPDGRAPCCRRHEHRPLRHGRPPDPGQFRGHGRFGPTRPNGDVRFYLISGRQLRHPAQDRLRPCAHLADGLRLDAATPTSIGDPMTTVANVADYREAAKPSPAPGALTTTSMAAPTPRPPWPSQCRRPAGHHPAPAGAARRLQALDGRGPCSARIPFHADRCSRPGRLEPACTPAAARSRPPSAAQGGRRAVQRSPPSAMCTLDEVTTRRRRPALVPALHDQATAASWSEILAARRKRVVKAPVLLFTVDLPIPGARYRDVPATAIDRAVRRTASEAAMRAASTRHGSSRLALGRAA